MITTIKQWVVTNWAIIALVIVSFFLFKSCQGSKELSVANASLKTEVKDHVAIANGYLANNKVLVLKIDSLEKVKQEVKIQIAEVEKKTESDIKKVPGLTTKGIANYYKERYKLPVTITQYGVSVSDTIGKLNITELIQKDGCFAERKFLKQQLFLEEQKGAEKDTIINNYFKADVEMHKAAYKQRTVIENQEKSLKIEKNKKTFWKVAAGAAIGVATYTLIAK